MEETKEKTYEVIYNVTGSYYTTVTASSPEEARKIADEEIVNADFGPLGWIDWEINRCEPEK